MTEREHAEKLANVVLERHFEDPDSDISVLARQFLRALEREALYKREISAADFIVTIGDKQIVVPSIVKAEVDRLRAVQ